MVHSCTSAIVQVCASHCLRGTFDCNACTERMQDLTDSYARKQHKHAVQCHAMPYPEFARIKDAFVEIVYIG